MCHGIPGNDPEQIEQVLRNFKKKLGKEILIMLQEDRWGKMHGRRYGGYIFHIAEEGGVGIWVPERWHQGKAGIRAEKGGRDWYGPNRMPLELHNGVGQGSLAVISLSPSLPPIRPTIEHFRRRPSRRTCQCVCMCACVCVCVRAWVGLLVSE